MAIRDLLRSSVRPFKIDDLVVCDVLFLLFLFVFKGFFLFLALRLAFFFGCVVGLFVFSRGEGVRCVRLDYGTTLSEGERCAPRRGLRATGVPWRIVLFHTPISVIFGGLFTYVAVER